MYSDNKTILIHIHVIGKQIYVTFSGLDGKTLFEGSTGSIGFTGRKRLTPLSARDLIKTLAKRAYKYGFLQANVSIEGTGRKSNQYAKWITSENIKVVSIKNIAPNSTDN